jgi:hypothetical protein
MLSTSVYAEVLSVCVCVFVYISLSLSFRLFPSYLMPVFFDRPAGSSAEESGNENNWTTGLGR